MDAPVISITDYSDTQLMVEWAPVPSANNYAAEYKLTSDPGWTLFSWGNILAIQYSSLSPNTSYDARVGATADTAPDQGGEYAYSDPVTQLLLPSGNVGTTSYTSTPTSITFNWNVPTGGCDGYKISGDFVAQIDNSGTTFYLAENLSQTTSYQIYVTPFNATGDAESNTPINGTTTSGIPDPPPTVSFLATGPTSVNLTWTAPGTGEPATSYDIHRDGMFLVNVTETQYDDTGLSNYTYYSYDIYSKNSFGTSTPTNAAGYTEDGRPATPINAAASPASPTSISLSWQDGGGPAPDSYDIYRGGSFIFNTSLLNYNDTGLNADTFYSYAIYAVNTYGSSIDPANVSATTYDGIPDPPTNLTLTPYDTTTIDLSWSAPASGWPVDHYDIYRDMGYLTSTGSLNYSDTVAGPGGTGHTYDIYSVSEFGINPTPLSGSSGTLPDVPSNLSVSGVFSTTAQLSWSAATGANSYNVWMWNGSMWINVWTDVTNTFYQFGGLPPNSTVRLGVSSDGDWGESTIAAANDFTTMRQIYGNIYSRDAWPANNWGRMELAHAGAWNSSWFPGTLDVNIQLVDGVTQQSWIPPDDDNYRLAAHNSAGPTPEYANGTDFLYKGNYIHPGIIVARVTQDTNAGPYLELTNGALYYAGSPDSFVEPGVPGTITRHSLEILANEDI